MSLSVVISSDSKATYTAAILEAIGDSVRSIVRVGQILLDAKSNLSDAAFSEMVQGELPFGKPTADRFMAVASNHLLADPAMASQLPPNHKALYELSRVPGERLSKALREGEVRPDMPMAQISLLLPPDGRKGEIQRHTLSCLETGCNGTLKQFRSVPGHGYRKIFEFRLYECVDCGGVVETTEVITRSGPKGTKRYVTRQETNLKPRRVVEDGGAE